MLLCWMCVAFAICSESEVPNLPESGDRILPALHPGVSVMEENDSIMVPQWHQDRQSRFFCLFSRGFLQPHSLGPSEASASSSPLTRAFQGRQSHGKSENTSYPLRRRVLSSSWFLFCWEVCHFLAKRYIALSIDKTHNLPFACTPNASNS